MVAHFKKRPMGYGKRRTEGVARATAPNASVEQPVSKSLCHIEKLALKVRGEAKFEAPPAKSVFHVTGLYQFKPIGKVESWKDVTFRKTFEVTFSETILTMPTPEKVIAVGLIDMASRNYTDIGTYDMFLGFELRHADLDDAIYLPYMPIHALNENVLLEKLEKIRNSGRILRRLSSCDFEVVLCFMKQLTGSGVEQRPLKRKQDDCVVSNSVTKLCLATAVLQGIAYLEHKEAPNDVSKEKHWERIAKIEDEDEAFQDVLSAAEKLLVSAGICTTSDEPKKEHYTISDVETLQDYFRARYQLIVFADASHKAPVFTGPSLMNKNVIPLLCRTNHFEFIHKLPQFVGSVFYCVRCNVRFHSVTQHYNCPLRCRLCNGWGCMPDTPEVQITCDECQTVFFSVQCEKNHRLGNNKSGNTMCNSTIYCDNCEMAYKKYKIHRCFEAYCQYCKYSRPKGHQCILTKKLGGGIRAVPEKLIFVQVKCERVKDKKERVVLAMVFRCCISCRDFLPDELDTAASSMCENCAPNGRRLVLFDCVQAENRERDVLHDLCRFLVQKEHERFTIVFHDIPQCVSDYFFSYTAQEGNISPKFQTMTDGKLRSMLLDGINIRIVDSKYFFSVPLRELAASVGISVPFRICPQEIIREDYFNYIGMVPDLDLFLKDCNSEQEKKYATLLRHEMKDEPYVFVDELLRCTYFELVLLSATALTIETVSSSLIGIRLFEESDDLDSATTMAFRRNFLSDDANLPLDIGLGSKFRTSYSLTAMYYLTWRAAQEKLPIDSTLNVGEYRVPGTPYHLDGFIHPCEKYPRGLGIDIKGCYWHAHGCSYVPKMVARRELDVPKIRAQDDKRERIVKMQHDFEVVWECEIALLRRDPEVNEFMEKVIFEGPVETSAAVFPPRTEIFRYSAISDEQFVIRSRDLACVPAHVMRNGEFPKGEMRRLHGEYFRVPILTPSELLSQAKGILFCRVLPPRNLPIPVLPDKLNDHILYPLCRVCSESDSSEECRHSNAERILTGTWTTFELEVALEQGYVITEVLGAQHWDHWQTYRCTSEGVEHSIFSEIMDRLLIMEKSAIGFPADVCFDSEKVEYLKRVEIEENLVLNPDLVIQSEVMRGAARRLMRLPDVLGFKTDEPVTEIVHTPTELWKLLEDSTNLVGEIRVAEGEKVVVSVGKQPKEAKPTPETVQLASVLVGGQTRAKIHREMTKSGCEVLYLDATCIIYRFDRFEPDPLSSLGAVSDSMITEYFTNGHDNFCTICEDRVAIRTSGFNWTINHCEKQIVGMKQQMLGMLHNSPVCFGIRHQAIERNAHFLLQPVDKVSHVHSVIPFVRKVRPDGTTYPIGFSSLS